MEAATWYAIATLCAIALGPIAAVLVTRFVDAKRQKKERKLDLFRKLMQTRGIRLDPVHVAALNLVEIEFYKDKSVVEQFKKYIDHLGAPMPPKLEQDRFFEQRSDLFLNLLSEMGASVGYKFDKRELDRQSYVPQGWDADQNMQRQNMQLLGQLLSGQRAIPVTQFSVQSSPYPDPPQIEGPKSTNGG